MRTIAKTLGKGSRLLFPLSMVWRLIKQDKRGLADIILGVWLYIKKKDGVYKLGEPYG